MHPTAQLVLGEYRRTLDERYRVSIPSELSQPLLSSSSDCVLVKEQPGALSLWPAVGWQSQWEQSLRVIQAKLLAGRLTERLAEVQVLGRLLSTRHRPVQLTDRGRLLVPEGFREFLGVEPGGETFLVGAAVCVEIWRPDAWVAYLNSQIPQFPGLFERLSS